MNIETFDFGTLDFEQLKQSIEFVQRSVVVYGTTYPQPRLTKWYGPVGYAYSGLEWPPAPMPELLQGIQARVETLVGMPFNSVLCNLYRDGSDCVGWHADDEAIFGGDPVVASLSFGATRTFKVRKNDDHSVRQDFELRDGMLLVMGKGVQPGYKHSIPKTKKPVGARINLTFRPALDGSPALG